MSMIRYSLPSVPIRNDIPLDLLQASENMARQLTNISISYAQRCELRERLKQMLLSSDGTKLKYEIPDDENREYEYVRRWIREYFKFNEDRKSMDHKPIRIPIGIRQWRQAEELVKEIHEDVHPLEDEHELRIYLLDEILETLEGYPKYLIPAAASPLLRDWMQDLYS